MRYDSLACNVRQDATKYFDLFVKNREAARQFQAAHIAANDCRMLQRRTEIVIQRDPWSGRSVCLRPREDSDCVWLYKGWINRF
jgi:hypothetical protein